MVLAWICKNNLSNGSYSALDKIILQGYKALQLQYFFTAGPDEVKALTIQVSSMQAKTGPAISITKLHKLSYRKKCLGFWYIMIKYYIMESHCMRRNAILLKSIIFI